MVGSSCHEMHQTQFYCVAPVKKGQGLARLRMVPSSSHPVPPHYSVDRIDRKEGTGSSIAVGQIMLYLVLRILRTEPAGIVLI